MDAAAVTEKTGRINPWALMDELEEHIKGLKAFIKATQKRDAEIERRLRAIETYLEPII